MSKEIEELKAHYRRLRKEKMICEQAVISEQKKLQELDKQLDEVRLKYSRLTAPELVAQDSRVNQLKDLLEREKRKLEQMLFGWEKREKI